MDRLARFVATHAQAAWIIELVIVLGTALAVGLATRDYWQREQLARLDATTAQSGSRVMSATINGALMGAILQLGLTEEEIKQDGHGRHTLNDPQVAAVLEATGRAFGVEGVFVVSREGVVGSSWNSDGSSSTGLNVRFRPYYQMAMQGKESVYAAVSLARGDRALYFSVPMFSSFDRSSVRIGAVVARILPSLVDRILLDHPGIAILLSPQGVVFASNRPEWVGFMAEAPSLERMAHVRESRQFGNMFENRLPSVLPVGTSPGITRYGNRDYAVSESRIQWNDPNGDWKLVLMEDLSSTVRQERIVAVAAIWALVTLLMLLAMRHILRNRYQRTLAAQKLETFAEGQKAQAWQKSMLAALSLKLQQATSIELLGQVFLSEAHQTLGALQGVLYVVSGTGGTDMRRMADFACIDPPQEKLTVGEGLLGQCAADGKTRVFEADDDTFWKIHSGLGEAPPRVSIMLPLLRNNIVLGVAEMAFPQAIGALQLDTAGEMVAILASNLEMLCQREAGERALAETSQKMLEVARMEDFERFSRLALDRERRIMQLKQEVNRLAEDLGYPVPYATVLIETAGDHRLDPPLPEPDGQDAVCLPDVSELIGSAEIQSVFANFCESAGIAAAIVDPDGKVLAASCWRRVCRDFHRENADSCVRCVESDCDSAIKLEAGETVVYQCKNGMAECVSPIVVDGRHLASVIVGQFHRSPPDHAFFYAQARQYGFDEAEYLRAVSEAPVIDEKCMPMILGFLTGVTRLLTAVLQARLRVGEVQRELSRQAEVLKQERLAVLNLAEDVEQAGRTLEQTV